MWKLPVFSSFLPKSKVEADEAWCEKISNFQQGNSRNGSKCPELRVTQFKSGSAAAAAALFSKAAFSAEATPRAAACWGEKLKNASQSVSWSRDTDPTTSRCVIVKFNVFPLKKHDLKKSATMTKSVWKNQSVLLPIEKQNSKMSWRHLKKRHLNKALHTVLCLLCGLLSLCPRSGVSAEPQFGVPFPDGKHKSLF